jgi:hypothetical protein
LFLMARDGALTHVQAVVALTVMTLFVPCVANFLMIVKERGLRTGLAILSFVTVIAVGTGGLLNAVWGSSMSVSEFRPLSHLKPGARGRIARVTRDLTSRAERLAAMGVSPARRCESCRRSRHRLRMRSDRTRRRADGRACHSRGAGVGRPGQVRREVVMKKLYAFVIGATSSRALGPAGAVQAGDRCLRCRRDRRRRLAAEMIDSLRAPFPVQRPPAAWRSTSRSTRTGR